MHIPSVASHFLAAFPRKAVQQMKRGIQNKLDGARLEKRFRYKRMDSDKSALHKHASQCPVGFLRTVEGKICKFQSKPAPYGEMLLSTGVMAPVRKLFEVANQRPLAAPVLRRSAVIPRRDADLKKTPENLPDVIPSSDTNHADNHAEVRTRFIRQIRRARRELFNGERRLLIETMGKEGRVLKEAVLRCDREYERKYSLEFQTFFFQRIGKEASVAETLEQTLHQAHAHAAGEALMHISTSQEPDMRNYQKFLSKFEVKYRPAQPPAGEAG